MLLIGGGGREHALAWRLAQSPLVERLYAAPGNPGIARHAACVPVGVDAHDELLALAERERIDFAVIGPEVPLVAGLADRFAEQRILALGPSRDAARLEGSKDFAKILMRDHGIPTADSRTFDDLAAARDYYEAHYGPSGATVVVKADGLAAGKGVVICPTVEQAVTATEQMLTGLFGTAGRRVVAEEFLRGPEVSFFALCNGSTAVALGAAQDHKTVDDGDRGPNTGGMGAYSPVPGFDAAAEQHVMDAIVTPVIAALAKQDAPYRGVLYVGLIMTSEGRTVVPKVLEFNCRFGDPECQVLMARIGEDLVPLLHGAARGERLPEHVALRPEAAVCVVMASGGYPGEYRTGLPIQGVDEAERLAGVQVFHAGTAERDGRLVTAGGRVLGVTATAPSIATAIARAYDAVGRIQFDGAHHRRDIGRRTLGAGAS